LGEISPFGQFLWHWANFFLEKIALWAIFSKKHLVTLLIIKIKLALNDRRLIPFFSFV